MVYPTAGICRHDGCDGVVSISMPDCVMYFGSYKASEVERTSEGRLKIDPLNVKPMFGICETVPVA